MKNAAPKRSKTQLATLLLYLTAALLLSGCQSPITNPSSSPALLTQRTEELRSAPEIQIWNPMGRTLSEPITTPSIQQQLADWLAALPLRYDEEETARRRAGEDGGGFPVVIVLPNQHDISIHEEHLIIDKETAYAYDTATQRIDIKTALRIAGIIQPPVSLSLDYSDAVVLREYLAPLVDKKELDAATAEVIYRLEQQLLNSTPLDQAMSEEEREEYISNMKKRTLGLW